ncbi:MAG TPA: acetyltransferase [Pirellulales bacterium]|nr:acetyltransferase [Pirellulales bacterium]
MVESNARRSLVIWGTSGHARVVADIVRLENRYSIVGFLDDSRRSGDAVEWHDATVLGGRAALPSLADQGIAAVLIAIGSPHVRLQLAELSRSHGLELATAVHPRAVIACDVAVGPGSVVMAGGVVNPGARLGLATIVNTLASVDHGCTLGEGATICPGARLGGNVTVDRGAWVGIGATVRERIHVGANAVIGAGAVVVHDVPPLTVVVGIPARVIRTLDAPWSPA